MTTPNQLQKIRDALAQLDPTNPDHWTDDGLPRTSVVQKIASDQTIKRQDIQMASPGFERAPGPAPAGVVDPLTGDPIEHTGADASGAAAEAPGGGGDSIKETGGASTDDDLITDEAEAHRVYDQMVVDAQHAVATAQQNIKAANAELIAAQKALQSAVKDRNSAFPPLSAAENVKQHIASENAMRAARVGMRGAPSQLDLAMRRSNSRGWRRPNRKILGTQTGAVA